MLYLLLAIASSTLISVIMRASERHVKSEMGMFMANYAVCIFLSLLYLPGNFVHMADGVTGNGIALWLGVISGILYLANFVFMKRNMVRNGIVLTSTFMKLGVLVPTFMAVLVFREAPKGTQVLGFAFALLGILVMYFEKQAVKESNSIVWLMVLLVMSGLTDSMANIFEKFGRESEKDAYLLCTFVVAFLCALGLTLRGKVGVKGKDFLIGAMIGIPNYYSARFLLAALSRLDAVFVYPMYSVGTIVAITIAGICFFKENISIKKRYALLIISVAMVFLNI